MVLIKLQKILDTHDIGGEFQSVFNPTALIQWTIFNYGTFLLNRNTSVNASVFVFSGLWVPFETTHHNNQKFIGECVVGNHSTGTSWSNWGRQEFFSMFMGLFLFCSLFSVWGPTEIHTESTAFIFEHVASWIHL